MIKIQYFTDPFCFKSYFFEPILDKLLHKNENIDLNLIMCMSIDSFFHYKKNNGFLNKLSDFVPILYEFAKEQNIPINTNFYDNNHEISSIYISKLIKSLDKPNDFVFLKLLRKKLYLLGDNICDENYLNKLFFSLYGNLEINEFKIKHGLALKQSFEIEQTPTLIISNSNNFVKLICPSTYEECINAIKLVDKNFVDENKSFDIEKYFNENLYFTKHELNFISSIENDDFINKKLKENKIIKKQISYGEYYEKIVNS